MAANAIAGESRMGAVFGGMLPSGEHAANFVMKNLKT
jgi:thiamine thiazole synthase